MIPQHSHLSQNPLYKALELLPGLCMTVSRECLRNGVLVMATSLPSVLLFMQDLNDRQRPFSTVKVYMVAVAACHVRFGGQR